MNAFVKKIKSKISAKKGESLIEAMVAVMITLLSAAMLSILVSTAVSINMESRKSNDKFFQELTSAESVKGTVEGKITIDSKEIDIVYYGTDGGKISSYRKKE